MLTKVSRCKNRLLGGWSATLTWGFFRIARQPSTWARDPHSYTMVRVDNVQIRPAQASDLDQLARLCEALWPKSSAEEHAQELRLILGGKASLVLTMPLTIFVAEGNMGYWSVSWKSTYVRMRTAATHYNQWATS